MRAEDLCAAIMAVPFNGVALAAIAEAVEKQKRARNSAITKLADELDSENIRDWAIVMALALASGTNVKNWRTAVSSRFGVGGHGFGYRRGTNMLCTPLGNLEIKNPQTFLAHCELGTAESSWSASPILRAGGQKLPDYRPTGKHSDHPDPSVLNAAIEKAWESVVRRLGELK